MIRTQVYLPTTLYQEVQLMAQREKKARAAVIRELLEEGLANKKPETLGQALGKLIEVGRKYTSKNALTDLSVNHDNYLYDED